MKIRKSTIESPLSPLHLKHPADQCLFFDIETTGLSPRASSLYLIGALYFDPACENWQMIQWFADKHGDEAQIIPSFLALAEQYSYLYHFNGRTFDIPYILHKCEKYHIRLSKHADTILQDKDGIYSIDILSQIRPLKKLLGINNAKQTDLEHWLELNRQDRYNGAELISVYSQYMQDRLLHPEHAEALEQVLFLHNHDDIQGMLAVSQIMNYRLLFDPADTTAAQIEITAIGQAGRETLTSSTAAAGTKQMPDIQISFCHTAVLPKAVSLAASYPATQETDSASVSPDDCHLTLDPQEGLLKVPLVYGELKHFLPNPKDYYYLPAEDQAVYKSIGEFIDPSHRQKATTATCYLKRSGCFLPSLKPYKTKKEPANAGQAPLFFRQYRDKLSFYQIPDSPDHQDPFWKEYLTRELQAMFP